MSFGVFMIIIYPSSILIKVNSYTYAHLRKEVYFKLAQPFQLREFIKITCLDAARNLLQLLVAYNLQPIRRDRFPQRFLLSCRCLGIFVEGEIIIVVFANANDGVVREEQRTTEASGCGLAISFFVEVTADELRHVLTHNVVCCCCDYIIA